MQKLIILIVALVACVAFASAAREVPAWLKKVNWACTAECTAYYGCKAGGAIVGDIRNCPSPRGCDCKKFTWESDEQAAVFTDSVFNLACTAECGMYHMCVGRSKDASQCKSPTGCECKRFWFEKNEAQSDKLDIGCTLKCTNYYTCSAEGAWSGNNKNCNYPSGCECRKFFWDK
jgi:hypothetical protein